MKTDVKRYEERNIMALDEAGGFYSRHIDAMTSESLHSKSDIAAELGYRDMQIQALQAENEIHRKEAERLWGLLDDISTAGDMCKPEITTYFKYVNGVCDKAHEQIISDGYDLWWKHSNKAEADS